MCHHFNYSSHKTRLVSETKFGNRKTVGLLREESDVTKRLKKRSNSMRGREREFEKKLSVLSATHHCIKRCSKFAENCFFDFFKMGTFSTAFRYKPAFIRIFNFLLKKLWIVGMETGGEMKKRCWTRKQVPSKSD